MNYSDLHKAPSQSSEQGAPERIWLTRNQYGSIEGTWHKMEGLTPAIRELGRPIYEYTRSDICATLVEWIDEQIAGIKRSSMVESSRGALAAFEQVKAKVTRTALSQVKEGANKPRIIECADCGQKLNPDDNHSCRQQRKRNKR